MGRKILFISIGFNLLFLIITGLSFVKFDKVDAGAKKSNAVKRTGFHYYERTTLFNELPIPPGSIVFLGDSLTFRTEWSELFPGKNVINRGIGSDTTEGVLDRLDSVITAQPKQIFLLIGVNDLKNRSVSATFKSYSVIIDRIQTGSPNTEIFIQSLLPVNNSRYGNILTNDKIKKMNMKLRSLANSSGVHFIDLYSTFAKDDQLPEEYTVDGIHLTGKGYILWRESIKEYVGP
ncbi:GDSL-type esterase/lipase family protein [Bacillus norwichensis]|uniref:Lipase n=1 Tax=Bacillus norwichensis TaxID=2762217 RepID=A0ABR8VHL9_9BACI|nr:GDSL-type esterase/lipase family protein [Bacillus norwichensis]MBD8004268.1 lipase [Bacillus norwichensis]